MIVSIIGSIEKGKERNMEKNRSSKIIAVVALVVAVLGLTLGFAAFSNTLTITSSAYVSPSSEKFQINMSGSNSEITTSVIGTPSLDDNLGYYASPAIVSGSSISGLKANFTLPDQEVVYTFYVHNEGEYDAYLNSIIFSNVNGQTAPRVCTAVDPQTTTAALISSACESISVTIKVGEDAAVAGSQATINNHILAKNTKEKVEVRISYAAGGNRADGTFDVSFGDITLKYETVD